MPVITEGEKEGRSKSRRRTGKGFWLLLSLPVLVVGVIIASFFRPVEMPLGPFMALVEGYAGPGGDWGVERGVYEKSSEGGDAMYVVTDPGAYFAVGSPVGGVRFDWFRGHRARIPAGP